MSLFGKVKSAALGFVVKRFFRGVAKGEHGMFLKGIWDYLSGKKTWVGLIATFLPQFVSLVADLIRAGGGSPDKFMQLAGVLTVIVGSLHKLLKGE
jgi:hypothetical protein